MLIKCLFLLYLYPFEVSKIQRRREIILVEPANYKYLFHTQSFKRVEMPNQYATWDHPKTLLLPHAKKEHP